MKRYEIFPSSRFRKDVRLMQKRGYDLSKLDIVLNLLAEGQPLPPRNCDHELVGNYAGHRECHIQSDWLLVYRIDEDVLVLTLTRTGSHSDLF